MKIAICISGFTREYKECSSSFNKYVLQHLQKDNEVDIFFHGWNNENVNDIQCTYNTKRYYVQKHSFEKMQEIMDDVGIGYITKLDQDILKNRLKNNITGMFYNIYKCNELKKQYEIENNIKYDITIHTRPDNMFMRNLDIKTSENTIYFGGCKSNICDHFYYGKSKDMDKIAEIYLKLKGLLEQRIKGIGAEHLLHHYIVNNGMKIIKGGCNKQHLVYYNYKKRK